MKNIFTILFFLLSVLTFSQTKQEVKSEILKLRKQGDNLDKGLNDGFYCKKYFSEWHNFNYRKLYTYSPPKTVAEVESIITRYQSDIAFLENLKKDYNRPNGALSRYNSDASKLNALFENVRELEKSIDEYPYPLTWKYTGNCKNVIESINNKIRELQGFLKSKQNLKQELENNSSSQETENSKSGEQTNNNSTSNTNNSSSQQTGNNSSSNTKNNNSENQNTLPEKTEYQKKMERQKREQQYESEKIEIIGDAVVDFTQELINMGLFNSDPQAKARRQKARERRKEKRARDKIQNKRELEAYKNYINLSTKILDPFYAKVYERIEDYDKSKFKGIEGLKNAPYKFKGNSNWKVVDNFIYKEDGRKKAKLSNERIALFTSGKKSYKYGFYNKKLKKFTGYKYFCAFPFFNGKAIILNEEKKIVQIINEDFEDLTTHIFSMEIYSIFEKDFNIKNTISKIDFGELNYLNFYYFTNRIIEAGYKNEALYLANHLIIKYPNESVYFEMIGDILLNTFNKSDEAKEMFGECLSIDSKNSNCSAKLNKL